MLGKNRRLLFVLVTIFCVLMALQVAMTAQASPPGQELATCPVCPTCPAVSASKTPTRTVTSSPTKLPTRTPTATNTLRPTRTPTFTLTATVVPKPFTVQKSSPSYVKNIFHPERGCNWTGVGGQVLDVSGKWVNQIVIEIRGLVNGAPVDFFSLTGVAPNYGPGGYEIELGSRAFGSSANLSIRLYDLAGNELTYPLIFDTFEDCNKNQIIINFQQNPKFK